MDGVTHAAGEVGDGEVAVEGRRLSEGDGFEHTEPLTARNDINRIPPSEGALARDGTQPRVTREQLLSGLVEIPPQGVRIDGPPITAPEMFELSERAGVEFGLTMQVNPDDPHDRTYRVYRGDQWGVQTPTGVSNLSERLVAHTHPNPVDGRRFPSGADMLNAQQRYDALVGLGLPQEAAVERSLVVHGSGPGESTVYFSGPGRDPLTDEEMQRLGQEQPEAPGGRGRVPGLAGAALVVGEATVTVGDRMRDGESFRQAVGGVVSDLASDAYEGLIGAPHEAASRVYADRTAAIDEARRAGLIDGMEAAGLEVAAAASYLGEFGTGVAETVLGEDVVNAAAEGRFGQAAALTVGQTLEGITEGGAGLAGGLLDHGLSFFGADETGAAVRRGLTDGAEWLTERSGELATSLAQELGLDRSAETAEERARRLERERAVWEQPMP